MLNEWNGIGISYTGAMVNNSHMHDAVLEKFSARWTLIVEIFRRYTPSYINIYSFGNDGYYIVYNINDRVYLMMIAEGVLRITRDAFKPWSHNYHYDLSDPECFSKIADAGLIAHGR